MKRRHFVQKTLFSTGAMVIGAGTAYGAFIEAITQQNFNFMNENHPNLILINNFFQAYGSNDLPKIKEILAEDIKWHIPGNHPLSGTKTGIAAVMEFFQQLHKGAFKAEPIVMGVNDHYVIDCHRNWSNLEEGENLNSMSCLLWKIENNRIVEVFNFPEDQNKVDSFFTRLYK